MARMIKAREITPGMVIEWMEDDVFMRLTVKRYNPLGHAVWSTAGVLRVLSPDTDVEVIAAPPVIPPEPKALGARVKAGNRLFLRAYDSGCGWVEVTGNATGLAYTWEEVNNFGTVTVIDGDPSWEVGTGEDTPEQWDDVETALKHCDKVVDQHGDTWHYVDGVLYLTMHGRAATWPLPARGANQYGPFRRA